MTLDETTLTTALHDLAGTVPDNPARLSHVHHLARRRHRRNRAIGAGALAATMAAAVVGAEALASGGGRPAPAIRPASGGPGAPAPAPANGASATAAPANGAPAGALPACPAAPPQPNNRDVAPPSIGQQFTGGGTVTAPGTASGIAVHVDGGPMLGSDLTLTIGPASKVFVDEHPATGTQVQKGERVKFSATVVATASYLLDELHAGTPSAVQTPKQGASGGPAQPAVGDGFKVTGQATGLTGTTITVDVQGGSLPPGPVTFTLECRPAGSVVGKTVSVAGTRTGASAYDAFAVVVQAS
ncbi:MAG TPA: hypothetical protein VFA84_16055 [Acidimicrobiales bacterium]|nr:hypothetical protein [Acidimicrobiales bacterium]